MPVGNPNFQALLEPEALFPNLPSELLGIEMEGGDGACLAVEDEVQSNDKRQTALGLENAGLEVDRALPVPDEREFFVDMLGNVVDLADEDSQEGNADGATGVAAGKTGAVAPGRAAAQPGLLPAGVPTVEGIDEGKAVEGIHPALYEDDASSTGVREDDDAHAEGK